MPCPRTLQQRLEERQADVEYELRCLLNKQGQCVSGASLCYFFQLTYLIIISYFNNTDPVGELWDDLGINNAGTRAYIINR